VPADLFSVRWTGVFSVSAGAYTFSARTDDGMRVWVNGKLVHEHRGPRPLVLDEDRVPVELGAGDNAVLVKTEQRRGPWAFSLRVLEPGAVLAPAVEIGPAVLEEESSPTTLIVRTDVASPAPGGAEVTAEVIAPGGFVAAAGHLVVEAHARRRRLGGRALRGALHHDDRRGRRGPGTCTGSGDARSAAAGVVQARADVKTPPGRCAACWRTSSSTGWKRRREGGPGRCAAPRGRLQATELDLESAGKTPGSPHGFVRLAWVDEVDGSVSSAGPACRPAIARPALAPRRQLHGYNRRTQVRALVGGGPPPPHSIRGPGRTGPSTSAPRARQHQYRGFGERTCCGRSPRQKALSIDEDAST
jgi:hypothetical protein